MKEKNITINIVLNMIKTISSIIFPLITFPYVSRVLMPNNLGKVNFGASYVSYFTLLASLGITTYAIRECSANREDKNKLTKTASQIFSINIIMTFIAYVLLAISIVVFKNIAPYRKLIIIQSTVIIFTTLGCDWLNTAMEDFAFITVRTVVFQGLSLLLMFALVHQPEDYIKYAAITVISSSGANLVNTFYRKKFCTVRFVRRMEWKKHSKPIMLLFVMILAQTVFNSSDITMLGLMKGDYEVGLYSTAVKMSNLISQVVASLAWVVMPRMAFYFAEEDYVKINVMLKKTLNVLLTLGLPSAVGCICLSNEIILVISGEQYALAAPVLSILMIGFALSLMGGSFLGNMVLLPSKRESVYMAICCIATAVNIVMNYFMIPIWGANAAAGTTAFASLLILLMLIASRDKRIKIDYFPQTLVAPGIGCILIIIVCTIVRIFINGLILRTIACVLLSCIVYLFVQIILKNQIVLEIILLIKNRNKN